MACSGWVAAGGHTATALQSVVARYMQGACNAPHAVAASGRRGDVGKERHDPSCFYSRCLRQRLYKMSKEHDWKGQVGQGSSRPVVLGLPPPAPWRLVMHLVGLPGG